MRQPPGQPERRFRSDSPTAVLRGWLGLGLSNSAPCAADLADLAVNREAISHGPWISSSRLQGAEDDAAGVEVLSVRFVRGAAENVDHAANADVGESRRSNDSHVLLDEECTRDSTGPEIDVSDRVVRQRLLDDDVSYLHATSRSQHSMDFVVDTELVRAEVDHSI